MARVMGSPAASRGSTAPARAASRRAAALLLMVALGGAVGLGVGGCSGDGDDAPPALAGAGDNTLRFIVYFDEKAGADLSAYRKAVAAGKDTAEIEAGLREEAKKRHKEFTKQLETFRGEVVEYWFLTNAVTVELPGVNGANLQNIEGVVRVEPDRLLK